MVKLEMLVAGIPDFETDHPPVDFSAIARAIGIDAIRVEDPADVRDALADALARSGPVLIEFMTDSNALSMPPSITASRSRASRSRRARSSSTAAWEG